MKVGNPEATSPLTGVGTAKTGTPAASSNGKAASTDKPGAEASVQVELSATAAGLLGGTESDMDMAKVERISQQISEGTFKVNHEAIADKLIANAQELLGRVQPK